MASKSDYRARGCIYRRRLKSGKSVWAAMIDEPRLPGDNRRVRSKSGFQRKADAQAWIDTQVAEFRNMRWTPVSFDLRTVTVRELLDLWLDAVRPPRSGLRHSTWTGYASHCKVHIAPAVGHVAVRRLVPTDIEGLYRDLQEDKGLSPNTVRRVAATLSAALSWGVRKSLIHSNVCADAQLPKQRKVELKIWTER